MVKLSCKRGTRWGWLAAWAPFLVACGSDSTSSPTKPSGNDAAVDGTDDAAPDAGEEEAGPTIRVAPTETTYQTSQGQIHMPCQGQGPLTVVFLAGASDKYTVWDALVAALGPDVLTCRFDRPGVSPSYVPTQPVTPKIVSDALAETLALADVGDRVLLVGHSLGGVSLRVFGGDHPERVAAAVFLDPTVPSFALTLAMAEIQALGWDPAATEAQGDAVTKWTADVKIRVLSHDSTLLVPSLFTPQQQADWDAGEKVYAALTSMGSQEDVPGADHYVFVSQQAVVVQAIQDTLAAAQQ